MQVHFWLVCVYLRVFVRVCVPVCACVCLRASAVVCVRVGVFASVSACLHLKVCNEVCEPTDPSATFGFYFRNV